MPPKNNNKKGGKSKKQAEEDEFEKLLSDLNKVTKHIGLERSKVEKQAEETRKEKGEKHQAILEKRNQNDLEAALMKRQQQLKFQQLLEQIMMAQRSFLSEPNTEFTGETEKSNPHFDVAVGSMQGWRAHMEDAHVVDVNVPSTSGSDNDGLFCVFDGHSGKMCADVCKRLFPVVLREHMKKDGTIDFEAAYLALDDRLAKDLKDDSGCTAVSVHVTPTHVTCASVGDSRAVLARNHKAVALSYDHKPEDEAEHARITAAGGFVKENRVNGQLAMSRAMGDFTYKKDEALGQKEQLVIPLPDVIEEKRTAEDNYLVVACDGIFDVLTNEELVEFISNKKLTTKLTNEQICEALCNECLAPVEDGKPSRAAGTDNMTVMIVDLK